MDIQDPKGKSLKEQLKMLEHHTELCQLHINLNTELFKYCIKKINKLEKEICKLKKNQS